MGKDYSGVKGSGVNYKGWGKGCMEWRSTCGRPVGGIRWTGSRGHVGERGPL